MKKVLLFAVILFSTVSGMAQNVDNFQVGPYTVDYYENGEVKYRLRDNINLYEYFGLSKDTIIHVEKETSILKHAVQISGFVESSHSRSPKGIGIEGVWKQLIGKSTYFNAGLSLNMAMNVFYSGTELKRNMFEVGVPLQIEWGKLSHQSASLYGSVGIMPTMYTTLKAEKCEMGQGGEYEAVDGDKKSGFLITPIFEFGCNVPLGKTIMRIGVTGKYKINCGSKEDGYDIYHSEAGRAFLGAKIGFVL